MSLLAKERAGEEEPEAMKETGWVEGEKEVRRSIAVEPEDRYADAAEGWAMTELEEEKEA